MRSSLLEILRCPTCGRASLDGSTETVSCPACRASYPVVDGIPALVASGSPLYREVANEVVRPSRLAATSDAERQRDYWEADLGHREADHPVVRTFSRQRWEHVARLLPLSEVKSALDVGAGNGFSTAHAPPGIDVVATDGSWHMLRRHPGPDRVLADAQALPFADRAFDLVYCWELLHHVAEPWRVLKEMARVTRRWVVVFEPNPWNPAQAGFALADPEHRWVLRFSRRYLLDEVRRAGLAATAFQRVGVIFPNKTPGWLCPVLAALPFRLPGIGISQLVVARREDA